MSNQTDIAVYDGASTPVLHTLKTNGIEFIKGVRIASWREALPSVPDAAQVQFVERMTLLSSGVKKLECMTVVPVMESINGANISGYTAAQKVAFEDKFITTYYRAPRATPVQTRIAQQIHLNILNNVATSVAAVASGWPSELFQNSIFPS